MRSPAYRAGLLILVVPVVCALSAACGVSSAAPAGGGEDDARGPFPPPAAVEGEVVLETGFEPGEDFPRPMQHSVTDEGAHSGRHSLTGVDKDRDSVYRIPIEGRKGHTIRVSLWQYSAGPASMRVSLQLRREETGERRPPQSYTIHSTGGKWLRVERAFVPDANRDVWLSILWPWTFGGRVETPEALLDDVRITDMGPAPDFSLDHAEQFPALTVDGAGTHWLAVDERRDFATSIRPQVGVFRVTGDRRERVATLRPDGITGMSPPAVAPLSDGCLVAFGAEVNGSYRMVYALVTPESGGQPELRTLSDGGNANIAPAVAASGDRVCVVWESNARGARGILASWVTPQGHTEPTLVSSPTHDDRNPSITATDDGRLFVAWDSMRDANVDIYGAWWRDGTWQPEARLTRDPRIERHVSLAAHRGEVWLAWQAQSFLGRRINHVMDQRVVVAKVEDGALRQPRGLWEALGDTDLRQSRGGWDAPANNFYLRPKISFDPQGRLWLTARKSMGHEDGWQATAWCWARGRHMGPEALWSRTGRWQPAPLAWGEAGGLAAVEYDRMGNVGLDSNWPREVGLVSLEGIRMPPAGPIETVDLEMPATTFSLAEHMQAHNVDQPRQHLTHAGERLTLYWGDLHDHSDISVCARAFNPPSHDLYANERDIDGMDFAAVTDHGYNIDEYFWAFARDSVTSYFDPGRFVTLLAEEWTSKANPPAEPGGPKRYGHRNIIFRNPRYPRFFDCFDGDISPDEVWQQLEGDEFISIPHQIADWKFTTSPGGNPPTDWNYHDEHDQPLAEIFQSRGSYEYLGAPRQAKDSAPMKGYYVQDAWEKGIVIGVIASPDHGGGMGRAAVWAPELTRDSLFEAFHARHTFGTTGPKMALFFSAGDAMMGDKVIRSDDGPISFNLTASTHSPVKQIVIFRNNEIVYQGQPGKTELELDWRDLRPPVDERLWYYTRIHCEDDALAWSSPIWFER
jgi:hypothetical protein